MLKDPNMNKVKLGTFFYFNLLIDKLNKPAIVITLVNKERQGLPPPRIRFCCKPSQSMWTKTRMSALKNKWAVHAWGPPAIAYGRRNETYTAMILNFWGPRNAIHS